MTAIHLVAVRRAEMRSRGHALSALCGAVALAVALACGPAGAQGNSDLKELIDDLVAANQVLAKAGVVDSFGHVSARHPANPDRFLLSQAKSPARVTADDIMEFDLDGRTIDGRDRPTYSERFIHAEIYRARKDVNGVIHSHSPGVIPFGVTQIPLRAISHTAPFLASGVPVFEIRTVAGMSDLLVTDAKRGKALAETLGDRPVALMRGHGMVVVGPSLRRTVVRAVYTEINARLLWQVLTLGTPITYLSPEEGAILEKRNDATAKGHGGDRVWENLKADVLGTAPGGAR